MKEMKAIVNLLGSNIPKQTKILFWLVFFCMASLTVQAQEKAKYQITENDYANEQVAMADAFRADGKIYVVVAVILVIFAGITFYLIRLDRKVSQLEKELLKDKTSI